MEALYRVGPARFRIGSYTYFLAFARDGKTLLSVNRTSSATDGLVRRWDAASGKQLGQFPLPQKVGTAQGVALSPDGKLLAVLPDSWEESPVHLIDAHRGDLVRNVGRQEDAAGIAFSGDGRFLATTDRTGKIRVWDPTSGKVRHRLEGRPSKCRTLAFSPDGRLLGSVHQDNIVRLWDRAQGRELRRFDPVQRTWPVQALAFSPDGKLLAAHRCGTIDLWSTTTGEPVCSLALGTASPSSVLAFSPDGKLLAGNSMATLCLWAVASGELVCSLKHDKYLVSAAFSPDGTMLASADDNIHLWQVPSGRAVHPAGADTPEITSAAFAPDGKLLVTGGPDDVLRLWDAVRGKPVRHFRGCPDGNTLLGYSADGKLLISRRGESWRYGQEFFFWDLATGKEVRSFRPPTPGFNATLSPSGRTLAWYGGDVAIHVRDVASGTERRPWPRRAGENILRLQFSPGGNLLAVNGAAGRPSEILDLAAHKTYPGFPSEQDLLGFSPDGKVVARTDREGRIHFQEAANAHDLACSAPPDDATGAGGRRFLTAAAFSPDGKTLALAMDPGPIRLWECATGKERLRLTGHLGRVEQLAFSPDGNKLVSVGTEKVALVWRLLGPVPGQESAELSVDRLKDLWEELANEDGRIAYRALRRITSASPGPVVDLLRREVRRDPQGDLHRIARLLADLDADDFTVRERATSELEKLGPVLEEALAEALQKRPNPEARRRMERLLAKVKQRSIPPQVLRRWRAVEVLEHLGTPEARRLLEALCERGSDPRLCRESKEAMGRLTHRLAREP